MGCQSLYLDTACLIFCVGQYLSSSHPDRAQICIHAANRWIADVETNSYETLPFKSKVFMSGQVAPNPPSLARHQLVLDLFLSRRVEAVTRHSPHTTVSGPPCCWMLLDIALVRTFIVIMPQPGQRVKIRPGSIPQLPSSIPWCRDHCWSDTRLCKPDVDAWCCQSKVARGACDGQWGGLGLTPAQSGSCQQM